MKSAKAGPDSKITIPGSSRSARGLLLSSELAIDEITPVAGGKKKIGKAGYQAKNSNADDDTEKAGIIRKRREEEQET